MFRVHILFPFEFGLFMFFKSNTFLTKHIEPCIILLPRNLPP